MGKDKQITEGKGFSGFFPHSQWLAAPTHTETGTQGFGDLTSSQLVYERTERENGMANREMPFGVRKNWA